MVTKAVISHYYSGQGRLAAGLRGVDGQPLGLRPVGNVNELTLTISGDTTTIRRPVNGKLVDVEVYTKSTSIKVSAKLESATARNLAMLTHGAFGDERPEYIVDVNARGFFGALQPLRGMGTTGMSARIGATLLTAYQDDVQPWDFMPADGGAGVILNDGMDAPVDKLATVGTVVSTTAPTDVDGITRFTLPVPETVKPGQRVMLTGFTHSSLIGYNNKAATIVGCTTTYVDLLLGNVPQALAGDPGRLILDGVNLAVEYTSAGYSQYTATTDLGGEFYLRFDGLNTVDEMAPVTVEVWRVKLDPSCVRSLLNDELEQVTLTGTVLYDRFRPFTPFYTEKFLHLTSVGAKDAPLGDTGFFSGWDTSAGGGPGGGGPGGGTGSNTFPSVDWLKDYLNGSLGEGQFAADVVELLHSSEVVRAEIDTILDQVNSDLTAQEAQVAQLTTDAQTSAQNYTDLAVAQAAETATRAQETADLASQASQHVTDLTALAAAAQATADQAAQDFLSESAVRSQAVSDLVSEQAAQAARLQQAADDLLTEQNVRAAAISASTQETADNLATEVADRISAINAETTARVAAITQEVTDRNVAIDIETQNRVDGIATATTTLNAAIEAETTARAQAIVQEAADRAAAISAEAQLRLDGIAAAAATSATAVQAVANDLATETATRASAITSEAQSRVDGLAAEAASRTQAISQEAAARASAIETAANVSAQAVLDEAAARGTAITTEVTTRQAADNALSTRIDTVTVASSDNAAAIQTEATARASADSAEATQRTDLATQVRGAYTGTDAAQLSTGLIHSERVARVTADAAMATDIESLQASTGANAAAITTEQTVRTDADSALGSRIDTVKATADNAATSVQLTSETTARTTADSALGTRIDTNAASIGDNTAAITAEAATRATNDSTEASLRNTLATQMRGSYTGSDLTQVTSGLIYQETSARSTQYESIAQQMTLLSAGVGEQFDYDSIWYFNTSAEGWTGNGSLTWAGSWLRPGNVASGAYLASPIAIDGIVNGAEYNQVRLRIRKTGSPVWAGKLWWKPIVSVVFATADGVANTFQLKDGTGADIIADATVSAIHRTDWQGRAALSAAPRMNQLENSEATANWGKQGSPTLSPGADVIVGSRTFSNTVLITGNGTNWYGIGTNAATLSYGVGETHVMAVVFDVSVGSSILMSVQIPSPTGHADATLKVTYTDPENPTASAAAPSGAATFGSPVLHHVGDSVWLVWAPITFARNSTDLTGQHGLFIATGSNDPAAQTHPLAASFVREDAFGPYILTTTSQVTVTDYTYTDSGQVTLGQVPDVDAVLDWDGSGTTATGPVITLPAAWDDANSVALTEPTYDENGIGLVIADTVWPSDVGQIKFTLSDAQSAADAFDVDWVAIGRPAPGASSAALASEGSARAAADAAEVTARQTLSTQLIGTVDPAGITLANITNGLVYDERTARSTADAAEVTARQSLSATLTGLPDPTGKTLANLTSGIIYDERTARVSADTAMASDITTLQATVGTNTGAITTEASARADADSALSTRVDSVTATANNAATSAALNAEITARANADTAMASDISTLQATAGDNAAAITAEATARVDADGALSTRVDSVTATADAAATKVSLTTEQTARVDADTALGTRTSTMESRMPSGTGALATSASVTNETTARTTADTALSTRIDSVTATANNAATKAALTTEQTTRATADTAMAQDLSLLGAHNAGKDAFILNQATVKVDASTTLAQQLTSLSVADADNDAAIAAETTARVDADGALSTRVDTVTATANNAATKAALTTETTARTNADTALGSRIDVLTTTVDDNTAAITSEETARADGDSVNATSITNLQASLATTNSNVATAQAAADAAAASAVSAAGIANSKGKVLIQSTVPATADRLVQNLWIDTTGGANTPKKWSGSAWVAVTDKAATDAAAAAVAAQNTADAAQLAANANAGAISSLQTTVTQQGNTITAHSTSLSELTADVAANVAAIADEASARASSDQAETTARQTLSTALVGATDPTGKTLANVASGLIYDERQARSTADTTEVTARQSLSAKLTGVSDPTNKTLATLSSGLLFDERTARVTSDSAMATDISSLQASSNTNAAAITSEATARTDADGALSTRIDSVTTTANNAATKASLTTEQTTRANADTAMAQDIALLGAHNAGKTAFILDQNKVQVDATTTLAQKLTSLTTADGTNATAITTETTARTNADGALGTRIDSLTTTVGGNTSAIQAEQTARASGDSAEANARNTLATQILGGYTGSDLNAVTSGLLYQEKSARSTQHDSVVQQLTMLQAGAGEQFDYARIWYFDDSTEGWSGNGAPSYAGSFLRPANAASSPYVVSPLALDGIVSGAEYNQIRLRVSKTGAPVWAGWLWWKPLTSVQFATADGVASTYQLQDASGAPIISDANVSAIHRTDWQGRQLLYPTPRTNVLKFSDTLDNPVWRGAPSKTLTSVLFAGQLPYYEVKKTTTASSESAYQSTGRSVAVGDVVSMTIAVRAGTQTSASVGILSMADTWGPASNAVATIISGPGSLVRYAGSLWTINGLSASQDTLVRVTRTIVLASADVNPRMYPGMPSSIVIGDSNLFTRIMLTVNGVVQGSYIPTATAPVTVTDYTYTPDGQVTLGQIPDVDAVLDWDGSGTTASGTAVTLPPDWDTNNRIAIDEPTYDSDGVGLVSVTSSWTDKVGQIRVDLTTAQTATDFQEIDWVAIGRPAPGASSAALSKEALARASADASEVTAREMLSTQLVGVPDPTGSTLTTISSGLLFDERTARSTADTTEVAARESLSATLTGVPDPTGKTLSQLSSGLLYDERTARATADTSMASSITSLDSRLTSAEGVNTGQATAISGLTTRVTAVEGVNTAQSTSITSLTSSAKALQSVAADLIPNPTFDPAYDRMGYVVIPSTDAEVPVGCPFPYVAKLAFRDHEPNINAISVSPGDVLEFSALLACSTGAAAFSFYFKKYDEATKATSPAVYTSLGTQAVTATWTRLIKRYIVPADGSLRFLRPFLQINQNSPYGTIWYVADWHVRNITAAATAQTIADATATAVTNLTTRVTAAEGDITAQADDITALQTSVNANTAALTTEQTARTTADSAQVSSINILKATVGANLLPDGSFEGKLWVLPAGASYVTTARTGTVAVQFTGTGTVGRSIVTPGSSPTTTVIPGRTYRATVYYTTSTDFDGTVGNAKLRLGSQTGSFLADEPFTAGKTTYTACTVDFTVPTDGSVKGIQVTASTNHTTGLLTLDDISFIDVTDALASAASVSEEQTARVAGDSANATAITNLDSRLTAAEGTGTATATAVDGLTTRVTNNEGQLASLSTSLTALTDSLDTTNASVTQLQSDVNLQSSAINLLTSRVTDAEAGLVSQGDATTALDNRLDTVEVDLTGVMSQAAATATAVDTLTNRVAVNEGNITSASAAITTLNNSVYSATAGLATKASAAALSSLDTRVATAEGTIGSQGTSITSLQNTINNPTTGLAAKASATALQTLTNTVNDANTGLATKASSTALTALSNTVNNATTGLPSKASADALTALTTRVTNVEAIAGSTTTLTSRVDTIEGSLVNEIITRANQTGALSASVNSLSTRLGTAEDSLSGTVSGLASLTTRVDTAEGTINSQGTSLTQLQAQVNALDLDAGGSGAAISALDTRVTANEDTLTSQGSAITSLQNSVTSANKVFIQDTAPDTTGRTTNDLWINTTGGANKLYGFNGTTWVLRQDTSKNSIFVQGTAPTAQAVNDVWFDTSRNNRQFRWNGTAWVEITDTRVAANATAITNLTTRVTAAEGVNSSQSTSITTLQNTVNDSATGVAATAAAVGTLTSRVDTVEGTVSSNSLAVTSLQNTVNDAGTGVAATANALNTLTTRVAATETTNTSQGSAITSLQNTVNNATTGVTATANAVSALTTRVTNTETANSSQGSAITSLQNTVNNGTTGVTATASAVSALTTRVTSVEGVNSSQASSISSISTTVNGHTSTISSQQTSLNGVLAKAGIALDVNGYVTGWQLNNNGSSGSMTILASRFTIVSPGSGQRTEFSGGNWRVYDTNNVLRVQMGTW